MPHKSGADTHEHTTLVAKDAEDKDICKAHVPMDGSEQQVSFDWPAKMIQVAKPSQPARQILQKWVLECFGGCWSLSVVNDQDVFEKVNQLRWNLWTRRILKFMPQCSDPKIWSLLVCLRMFVCSSLKDLRQMKLILEIRIDGWIQRSNEPPDLRNAPCFSEALNNLVPRSKDGLRKQPMHQLLGSILFCAASRSNLP